MQIYKGKSVFGEIAIGKINVYKKGHQKIKCVQIENVEQEVRRFQTAKEKTLLQLNAFYQQAVTEVGETNAAIFEMHKVMLNDENYLTDVQNIIRTQRVNAEYAVAVTRDKFLRMFADMDDDYMRARELDIRDISERLIMSLGGGKVPRYHIVEPGILLAEELTPSDWLQIDKVNILALVTNKGSVHSHTSIMAKTMGIPALIVAEVQVDSTMDGKMGIVDGEQGVLYVEPDEEVLSHMKEKQKDEREERAKLSILEEDLGGQEKIQGIKLYANIGDIKDIETVVQSGAGGIGLFRSEMIFLGKLSFPTEEEQFQIYKTIVEAMQGKKVIIRTLDIGTDKHCDSFSMEKEENPALGLRGIRVCLNNLGIFKTQLRALLRAAIYGNLEIMYPMITSVSEVRKIKEIVGNVKAELDAEGVPYGDCKQGIMIETPAAVMISDELAKEVEFFSIGTNDLTQYTLAVDRQNAKLEEYYNPHHPAILRMIALVVENAHREGIRVSICGELGAEVELTEEFLKMGVDELSVAPGNVPVVRRRLLELM